MSYDPDRLKEIYEVMAKKLCDMHEYLPVNDDVKAAYIDIHDSCIDFCSAMIDFENRKRMN